MCLKDGSSCAIRMHFQGQEWEQAVAEVQVEGDGLREG